MARFNKKLGSILLKGGIDVSTPAEYLDDQSLRDSVNFDLDRDLVTKRVGETRLGGVVGSAVLTLSGNASNTNTVVIGAKTYTFQTTLTDVDGNVKIGASASDSIDNLIAAINLAAGAGTTYAASMTAHPLDSLPDSVIASAGAGDTMDLVVNNGAMTSIATTETLGSGAWGAATITYPTDYQVINGRQFTRADVNYNVRVGVDKIERYNVTNSNWIDITGSDLTGATIDLVDTAVPLLSGAPILCVTNGIDAIRKWTATGNTADLGGSPPVAKFIQEYKTYLVCANIAGGTDISERVQWSDTADPEEWATGNSGTVDLVEDNESITGLNIFGNYIAVHKPSAIYLGYPVSSTSIFQFDRKSTGAGTVANGSIVNLPSGHQIFLSSDGIRIFNGISAPIIESKINDDIRDNLNDTYSYRAYGLLVKDRDEVWFGIPIGSQTWGETIYKYNYKTGVVYKDSRTGATSMWIGSASASLSWDDYTGLGLTWDTMTQRWNERSLNAGADQINIGKSTGLNTIIDSTKLNDNSVAINSQLITKDFQADQNGINRWKRMELWAKGGSVNVEYSIDGGDSWTSTELSPYTLTNSFPTYTSPIIIYFDVIATKIRFRFSNEESDESLTIKQFTLEYVTREQRR